MSEKTDNQLIKEYGAMLPRYLKHKSGKFKIVVTDEMRNDFGKLYLEDIRRRMKEKNNGIYENKNNV